MSRTPKPDPSQEAAREWLRANSYNIIRQESLSKDGEEILWACKEGDSRVSIIQVYGKDFGFAVYVYVHTLK